MVEIDRPTPTEELGLDILDAVIKGVLTPKDARKIWNRRNRQQSADCRSRRLRELGKMLGDNSVSRAYGGFNREIGRRRKSRAAFIGNLDPGRRHSSEWGDEISEGVRRSWREGNRPTPAQWADEISVGMRRAWEEGRHPGKRGHARKRSDT